MPLVSGKSVGSTFSYQKTHMPGKKAIHKGPDTIKKQWQPPGVLPGKVVAGLHAASKRTANQAGLLHQGWVGWNGVLVIGFKYRSTDTSPNSTSDVLSKLTNRRAEGTRHRRNQRGVAVHPDNNMQGRSTRNPVLMCARSLACAPLDKKNVGETNARSLDTLHPTSSSRRTRPTIK